MNNRFKILYAEDEVTLQGIISELLTDEGYEVTQASNGLEAVKLLGSHTYDLLLTDFQMPLMNGAELLFWCRSHDLHFPIIFMSANIEKIPIEELALKDCCASHLQKPVGIEALLDAIEEARKRSHDFQCIGKAYAPGDDLPGDFHGQHFFC